MAVVSIMNAHETCSNVSINLGPKENCDYSRLGMLIQSIMLQSNLVMKKPEQEPLF